MMNLLSFNKLSLSIPLSPSIKQLDHCFPVSLDKCFLQLPVSMRRNIWIFSRDVSEQRNQFCALVAYFFPQNLDYFACQASKIIPTIKKKKNLPFVPFPWQHWKVGWQNKQEVVMVLISFFIIFYLTLPLKLRFETVNGLK